VKLKPLTPEELRGTLGYHERTNRCHLEPESVCFEAREMMFVSQPEGPDYYLGFGDFVIPDWNLMEDYEIKRPDSQMRISR
jgi:hypothetical protein